MRIIIDLFGQLLRMLMMIVSGCQGCLRIIGRSDWSVLILTIFSRDNVDDDT